MYIQVMPEADAASAKINPFDVTKVWLFKDHPRIEVGEIVLDRNPENYFADVEQAAFAPSAVVPGLGFSPDRMLQGPLFAYADAQRYRLGVNYHQIPVNKPLNDVHHFTATAAYASMETAARVPPITRTGSTTSRCSRPVTYLPTRAPARCTVMTTAGTRTTTHRLAGSTA